MITLTALLLTYFIHSSVFIVLALILSRFKFIKPDGTGEVLIKTAMILGIVTTGIHYANLNNVKSASGFLQWQLPIEKDSKKNSMTATYHRIDGTFKPENSDLSELDQLTHGFKKHSAIDRPEHPTKTSAHTPASNKTPINDPTPKSSSIWFKPNILLQKIIKILFTPYNLSALWLCIAVYFMIRKFRQWHQFKQVIRHRFSVNDKRINAIFSQLKSQAQLQHTIRLTECEYLDSPVVLNRNEVVLPLNFQQYMDSEHIKAALAHELAHIKRHDHLWLWLCHLIESLFFIQPLNRLISEQIYHIAEHRSDFMASQWTGNPHALAEALSKVAHHKHNPISTQLVPTMTSKNTQLISRIEHLLLTKRKNTASLTLLLGIFVTTAVLFAAPGFSINTVNATTKIHSSKDIIDDENTSNIHKTSTKYIDGKDDHDTVNVTSVHNGKVLKLKATVNNGFAFNEEETAIESFTSGNKLKLMTKENGIKRQLKIKSIDNKPQYIYHENGKARPFDDEAQLWFSTKIPEILRTTGINAEQRIHRIKQKGGNSAVLDEITLISSDHNQARYLSILFSMSQLSQNEFSQASNIIAKIGSDFEQANITSLLIKTQNNLSDEQWADIIKTTEKIGSDFEQAKTLISFTDHLPQNSQVNNAFANAVSKIGSDFELRRVIDHYLDKVQVSDEAGLINVLNSAKSIGSDFELSTLLSKNTRIAQHSPALFSTFMKLSKSIGSDFEQRRLYSELLKLNLNKDQLNTLVKYAQSSIGSDFELSSLLIEVISSQSMSDQHVEAVKQAAQSINSQHEKNRVLVKLIDKI